MTKTRRSSKLFAFLLVMLMTLALLVPSAFAAEIGEDATNGKYYDTWLQDGTKGDLTLYKTDEAGAPIAGAKYAVYAIAKAEQVIDNATGDVSWKYTMEDATLKQLTDLSTAAASDYAFTEAELDAKGLTKYTPDSYNGNASDTETDGTKASVDFSNLPEGYVYLVVETQRPNGVAASNNFFITVPMYGSGTDITTGNTITGWYYDITAKPKNITDTSAKKSVDSTDTSYSLGDLVPYKIEATVPSDINGNTGTASYAYKSYEIKDTASASLQHDQSTLVVTVKNSTNPLKAVTLTKDVDYKLTWDAATNSFKIELIKFTGSTGEENDPSKYAPYYSGFEDDDYLEITYKALVINVGNDDAELKNNATVSINGDKVYDNGDIKIYAYNYRLWKTDDDSSAYAGLKDAEFMIQNTTSSGAADQYMALVTYTIDGVTKKAWVKGTYNDIVAGTSTDYTDLKALSGYTEVSYAYKFSSNTEGLVSGIVGLAEGDYYLTEVTAPSGYTLQSKSFKITVDATSHAKAVADETDLTVGGSASYTSTNELLNSTDGTDYFSIQVINKKGPTLPQTGDSGIAMFLAVGGVLITAAVVLFVVNRKRTKVSEL